MSMKNYPQDERLGTEHEEKIDLSPRNQLVKPIKLKIKSKKILKTPGLCLKDKILNTLRPLVRRNSQIATTVEIHKVHRGSVNLNSKDLQILLTKEEVRETVNLMLTDPLTNYVYKAVEQLKDDEEKFKLAEINYKKKRSSKWGKFFCIGKKP